MDIYATGYVIGALITFVASAWLSRDELELLDPLSSFIMLAMILLWPFTLLAYLWFRLAYFFRGGD